MTWLEGTKVSESGKLPSDVDRKAAARRFGNCVLRQIFAFGYFHGDPHAANLFIQNNQNIGFYDLGLVGELSRPERESFTAFVLSLLEQDAAAATAALGEFAASADAADPYALRNAISQLMARHFHQPPAGTEAHRLIGDILRITARHDLRLPAGYYLALKALLTLDSAGRKLDPDFDLAQLALPVLRRAKPRAAALHLDSADAFDIGLDALDHLRRLPAALSSSIRQLNDGQLRIQFEHRGLDDVCARYESATNRVSASLFAGAVALGGFLIAGLAVAARVMTLAQAAMAAGATIVASLFLLWLLTRIMAIGRRTRSH
jgi:ubiquinone biosynthesis protein